MSEEFVIYASHVLKTKTIRIYDTETDEICDKQLSDKDFPSTWTNESMKEYIHALLKLISKKLDCLVLINGGDCSAKLIQAAASAVTLGTLLRIIPALMARFLYITNNLETLEEPKSRTLIILTKVSSIAEFHTLQLKSSDDNGNKIYAFIDEIQKFGNINITNPFIKYVNEHENGGTSVIIFDEGNASSKDEIAREYTGSNFVEMPSPQWHEMLISGGLYKASALMDPNPKDISDIKDFTIGFNILVNRDEMPLIEKGANTPIKINVTKKLRNKIVLRSNPTVVLKDNLLRNLKPIHEQDTKPEGFYQIEVEVDKNGIERVSIIEASSSSQPDASNVINKEKAVEELPLQLSIESLTEALTSTADPYTASHFLDPSIDIEALIDDEKSLILPKPADFMICLKDRSCCVCLPSEDKSSNVTTRIKNINGNEWTPLYISFLHSPPWLGEDAKADLEVDAEAVIYDILKFISQPFDEIEINPDWAFNIAYDENQRTVIEIQTWKGPHAVYPVNLLALTFVALHKEAERVAAGKTLKKVFIKKLGSITAEDKKVIAEALKIARLECAGIEDMPLMKN